MPKIGDQSPKIALLNLESGSQSFWVLGHGLEGAGRTMTLHLTGPALRFFETSRSLQPARQVNSSFGGESIGAGIGDSVCPRVTGCR